MCRRFVLRQEHYRAILTSLGIGAVADFISRYNIAPSSTIPFVRSAGEAGHAGQEVVALRWGLTPAWARSDEPAARPASPPAGESPHFSLGLE